MSQCYADVWCPSPPLGGKPLTRKPLLAGGMMMEVHNEGGQGEGGLECSAVSAACAEAMPARRPEAGPRGGKDIGGEE